MGVLALRVMTTDCRNLADGRDCVLKSLSAIEDTALLHLTSSSSDPDHQLLQVEVALDRR